MQLALIDAGYDRTGAPGNLDKMIDNNDPDVEENLLAMREFYGEEEMAKMTPAQFYDNYKKFASGLIF